MEAPGRSRQVQLILLEESPTPGRRSRVGPPKFKVRRGFRLATGGKGWVCPGLLFSWLLAGDRGRAGEGRSRKRSSGLLRPRHTIIGVLKATD